MHLRQEDSGCAFTHVTRAYRQARHPDSHVTLADWQVRHPASHVTRAYWQVRHPTSRVTRAYWQVGYPTSRVTRATDVKAYLTCHVTRAYEEVERPACRVARVTFAGLNRDLLVEMLARRFLRKTLCERVLRPGRGHSQEMITLRADHTADYRSDTEGFSGRWSRDDWNLRLTAEGVDMTMRFISFRDELRLMTNPPDDPDMWAGDLGLIRR
jgi:hypothetical protein